MFGEIGETIWRIWRQSFSVEGARRPHIGQELREAGQARGPAADQEVRPTSIGFSTVPHKIARRREWIVVQVAGGYSWNGLCILRRRFRWLPPCG
jgi:hypothetical protein